MHLVSTTCAILQTLRYQQFIAVIEDYASRSELFTGNIRHTLLSNRERGRTEKETEHAEMLHSTQIHSTHNDSSKLY